MLIGLKQSPLVDGVNHQPAFIFYNTTICLSNIDLSIL